MRKYLFLFLVSMIAITNYAQKKAENTVVILAKSNIRTENPSDWITIYAEDGLMGYLDSEGREVVPPLYNMIYPFGEYKEDWARVEVLGGLTGFIDSTGKIVVQPLYDSINNFGEYRPDWALVSIDDKYGFINNKGEEVVAPIYAEILMSK